MRARRLRPPDRGTRSRPTVQEGNTTAESPRLGHRILALLREHESLGCPAGPMIEEDIRRVVTELPGVEEVQTELSWDPPWTPELMSDDAKFILGFG